MLERRPATFLCNCSKPRLGQTLVLLGEKEIAELIASAIFVMNTISFQKRN
ncbi:Hsp33 family molecular chaperone HslO [Paradesulfitobacterium aromaticivorans]